MEIVVLGSAFVDAIIHTNRLIKFKSAGKKYLGFPYTSKTEIEELEFDVGGSAHNIAVSLSKFKNKVGIIGKVGNDPNGLMIMANLQKEGVDTKYFRKTKEMMSGFSQVFITPEGEKSILTYRGANDLISPEDVKENYFKSIKWFVFTSVLSQGSLDAVSKAIYFTKRNGGKVLGNPSINMVRYRKRELLGFLKFCDIVVMNGEEACELTGTRNEKKSLKKFLELGLKSVIVTRGKRGLMGYDNGKFYKKTSINVRVVDTTGAGDTFTAGFLHWFIKTNSFEESLEFGNSTAALNIMSVGASKNLPTESEVISLMERVKK
ncbi:MAG: carbohydrate kinase family protein [Candidatus Aenigmatarchaeota archaeon]